MAEIEVEPDHCSYCDEAIEKEALDPYREHCNTCYPHLCEDCGSVDTHPTHEYIWIDKCHHCGASVPREKTCNQGCTIIVCDDGVGCRK